MGLVCFRLKGNDNNDLNKKLLSNINESGKLHMVPAAVHGKFVIRFCVCAQDAKDSDIEYAWDVITEYATELLEAEIVKEKSGLPLDVLEHSNEEVGQVAHKVEISELMDLMERVHMPIQKQNSIASIGRQGSLASVGRQQSLAIIGRQQSLASIGRQQSLAYIGEVGNNLSEGGEQETANKPRQRPSLAKRLSKRQFSFTDTIEFVGMVNTAQDESMNPWRDLKIRIPLAISQPFAVYTDVFNI